VDHFSLDSVRETFAADVAAGVARAAEAARAILRALTPPPAAEGSTAEFDAAAHAFHAIKGSSSLLAIGPLAECAAQLEELAARGREALEEAAQRARFGRAAAEACLQGGLRLQEMAQLALGHQDEALEGAARELTQMLAELTGGGAVASVASPETLEPALPPPPAVDLDATFDFEDEPAVEAAAQPVAPAPSLADAAPFRAEARLLIESLLAGLEAARRNPGDEGPAAQVERTLEEIERVAMKAGWNGVAGVALQARNEVAAARCTETGLDPTLLSDLGERCHALLAVLGFPGSSVDTAEDAMPPEAGAELDSLFRDEARQACREAVVLAQGIAGDGDDETVTALGRLAHRLKGSAVLARHGQIEQAAAALQAACQARLDRVSSSAEPIVEALRSLRVVLGDDETPSAAVREQVTMEADPAVWEGFEIESSETLAAIEDAALKLEENVDPKAVLSDLFRYYHTLKGALHSVGLGPVARLVHRLEDLAEDLLEAAILPPLARLASLLLAAQERIRRALQDARTGFVVIDLAALERDLAALRAGGAIPSAQGGSSSRGDSSSRGSGAVSHRSSPSAADSEDVAARSIGDAVERRLVRVPRERLDAMMDLAGELLVSRSRLARRVARVRSLEQEMRGHGRRLVEAAEDFSERHEFRLAPARARAVGAVHGEGGAFGELELDRYDEVNVLARTLGEAASRLSQTQAQLTGALSGIAEDAQGFGTVVAGLQGEVTRARMIGLGQLFARLRAPVRDAAEREAKQVRLVTSGDDVTLDKALVDELYTPLLHLVRNAVAHGIETPAYRRGAGKDPVGTVRLAARQENGRVIVQVEDDGAGLDLPRLHRLAVEAGLLGPDVPVDAPEVAEAVFARGLSTRADVDDVSGRGIGGDVVHREVERMGGEVRVQTRSGAGTTFVLSLPMTLSITRSLWVQCGGETMALPLDFAQAIVDLTDADVHESAGVRRLRHGDGYVVLHSLAGLLGRPVGEERGSAVVVHAGTQAMAFAVDRVVGQEEIFVKPLGDLLAGHPLVSGVTLGGDGEMLPILDVRGLIQEARSERGAARQAEPRERNRRARVLFVDDSLSVRRVGEKFLAEEGIEVTLAVDGEDALARLRTDEFDLVFTDLEMPRLNGYDLIAAIRSSAALRHLPVVVVTSRSGRKHREHAEAVGATDYLTKPFTAESLRQLVVRWTRESRR
jgi:chemosensory pili system protein ChpA (sensor histidine kinase/response regulator)